MNAPTILAAHLVKLFDDSHFRTRTQTVILSKQQFPTRDQAIRWALAHSFKTTNSKETKNTWEFSQEPSANFKKDSFKTKTLTEGVKAVVGIPLKAPKLKNEELNLRDAEFELGRCKNCKLFVKTTTCKILEGPVAANLVCDAIQGVKTMPRYVVKEANKEAFAKGMVKLQPYSHKVIEGHNTPEGWILVIEDTMPKPHRFSLSWNFSVEHTSREHYWNQDDADLITDAGKR